MTAGDITNLYRVQDNFSYINSAASTAASRGLVSTVSSGPVQGKMPQAIRQVNTEQYLDIFPFPRKYFLPITTFCYREFLKTLDDQEWQSSLFTLLQNQTFNQVRQRRGSSPYTRPPRGHVAGGGGPVRADVQGPRPELIRPSGLGEKFILL